MINTRRKGNKARWECIQALQKEGWTVTICERTGKFVTVKDAWGIGDLIALKKTINKETGRFDTLVKVIQCTSNRPHAHLPYDEFANRFPGLLIEQWVRLDNKGWKVIKYWEGCGHEVVRLE